MINSCPYAGRCASEGIHCNRCANNPSIKEDHFEPKYSKLNDYVNKED